MILLKEPGLRHCTGIEDLAPNQLPMPFEEKLQGVIARLQKDKILAKSKPAGE